MTIIKFFIDEGDTTGVFTEINTNLVYKSAALFFTLHPNTFWKPGIQEKEQIFFQELKKNKTDMETVRTQLLSGINVNCKDDLSTTPVIVAAAKDDPVLLKILLDNGADPNWKNLLNLSAIYFAEMNDNMEMISILIEHNIDISEWLENRFPAFKNEKMMDILLNYVSQKKDGFKVLERLSDRFNSTTNGIIDKRKVFIQKYLNRSRLPQQRESK